MAFNCSSYIFFTSGLENIDQNGICATEGAGIPVLDAGPDAANVSDCKDKQICSDSHLNRSFNKDRELFVDGMGMETSLLGA